MIPVNEPSLGQSELENIIECVKSGWISSKGKYITSFEEQFAQFCGVRYGISTTNGTAALHLALCCLDLKKGDEVIVPTFTMVATAFAILYTGAKPVFVDAEAQTWNMDVSQIEDCITARTKAILPVHIYGHPVDMAPIKQLAKKHSFSIVEDAAEAHGAEYKGKKCGSLSDMGCFSFYANKIITTGEGGMVVTNNKTLAQKARLFKDLAHSPRQRFLHTHIAYNYRMTNMQAAIGLAQLQKAESFIEKKRRMAFLYHTHLKNISGLRLPCEKAWAKNVYWMYSIVLDDDFGLSRDTLRSELFKEGIETRDFFIPMHRQPAIKNISGINVKKKFPVADYISERGLYLPSGLTITEQQIGAVCEAIKKIQKKHRQRTLA